MNSVLTTHGYSVTKSLLSQETDSMIRKCLTVKPNTQQKYAFMDDEFPVYLESATRLYLPRQWANDTFGPAESSVLKEGDEILSFNKDKEIQIDIIEKFF